MDGPGYLARKALRHGAIKVVCNTDVFHVFVTISIDLDPIVCRVDAV